MSRKARPLTKSADCTSLLVGDYTNVQVHKMPKPNPNLLADALKRKAQGVVPALSATPKVEQPRRGRSIRSAGRTGKIMVSGWLPLEARSSFRMIQAKHPEKLMQDLIMEAM